MGVASIGGARGVYYVEGEEVSTGWNGPRGVEVPNVEVQHLRKWRYPDEEERGA